MNIARWLTWRKLRFEEKLFAAPPAHLRRHEFAIDIYTGTDPLKLHTTSLRPPALTWRDCGGYPALFVADPFMIWRGDAWHLFYEILDWKTHRGVIGHAVSANLFDWEATGVVLEEAYHLSYPHIFEHNGAVYMTAETLGANALRLYKASSFPQEWEHVADLMEGAHADPTLFHHEGTWYAFTCTAPETHDELRLYWAEELTGPWREHPASPIVSGDPQRARPAGRVIRHKNQWLRFAQDCGGAYGLAVRAFRITALDREQYAEEEVKESPVLQAAGSGWNANGMHHIDAHELPGGGWVACVDGWRRVVE